MSRRTAWRAGLLAGLGALALSLGPTAQAATQTPVLSPSPSAAAGAEPLVIGTPPVWDGADRLVVNGQITSRSKLDGQASAGVRIGDREVPATITLTPTAQRPVRTAVLVVDTSGSMSGNDLSAARTAADAYAAAVGPDVRLALVTFADTATVVTAPTTDRAALRAGLATLHSGGETALYDAVQAAAGQAGGDGNIVLLSDGGNSVGAATLETATAALRSSGVRLDAVAFKTAESETAALQHLAQVNGGSVISVEGAADLGSAFAAAAAAVPVDVTVTAEVPADVDPSGTLVVTAHLAETVYTATTALPARPAAEEPSATIPLPGVPRSAGFPGVLVIVVVLLAVLLGIALLALAWPRRIAPAEQRQRALAVYSAGAGPVPPAGSGDATAAGSALTGMTDGVLAVSERVVAERGWGSAIALRLDRAGLTLLPHEWLVARTCVVLVAGTVGFLLVPPRWLGLAVFAAIGWVATEIWLRSRQGRRCRAFADQLPDTLQVLASSLRSGFALPQALTAAQASGAEPMSSELGRALAAARIGVDLEDELEQIAVRLRSEEWRMAVMAIRIQRSVGGSLSEVLATTSTTLRERAALFRQARALSAEGRWSAYILLALPVVVFGILSMTRRDYLAPLWTTLPGVLMLIIGVLLMVVGAFWMSKVAKVEA